MATACVLAILNPIDGKVVAVAGAPPTTEPGPFTTTTTLTSSANPSLVGQTVTFTATVTSPAGPVTGSIDFIVFLEGSIVNVPLDANGHATFSRSFAAAGEYETGAEYGNVEPFLSSFALLVQVVEEPPATTPTTSPAPTTSTPSTPSTTSPPTTAPIDPPPASTSTPTTVSSGAGSGVTDVGAAGELPATR
jgi:hypothetical protein